MNKHINRESKNTSELFQKWVKPFKTYLTHARKMAPHTVRSYVSDTKQHLKFLLERSFLDAHQGPRLDQVTTQHLQTFIQSLFKLGLKPKSQARKISSMKSFYQYWVIQGEIEKNPAKSLDHIKIPQYLPEVPSETQINHFFEGLEQAHKHPERDMAMFELLYGGGLRVSELVALNWQDISFTDACVLIQMSKGQKTRYVPLGVFACDALEKLRDQQANAKGFAVFLNQRGQRITARGVSYVFSKYQVFFSESLHVTLHAFRHAYATHMLNHGADLRSIQELLGHLNLATTQKYTQVSKEKLQKVYRESHPRS